MSDDDDDRRDAGDSAATEDPGRRRCGDARRSGHAADARPGRQADAAGRRPADVLPGEVVRARSGAPIGHVQAVDGVSFQVPDGRLAGPGRRVRLRQVDHRPADHPAATSRPSGSISSRARTSRS